MCITSLVELQVKGFGNGDCYELVDTVVGSAILPWRPVMESTFAKNSNEAVEPGVERLPGSSPHGGDSLLFKNQREP